MKSCRAGTVYLRRGRFNHKDAEADLKDVEADLKVRLYEGQMDRSRSKNDR